MRERRMHGSVFKGNFSELELFPVSDTISHGLFSLSKCHKGRVAEYKQKTLSRKRTFLQSDEGGPPIKK